MSNTNILTSLGAADLDTKKLVSDLVAAVREPRQRLIDEAKKKAEVAISSVALLKSALAAFQEAATELGSISKLNKLAITNSNPSLLSVEPGGITTAVPGNHSLNIESLAQSQRTKGEVSYEGPSSVAATEEITLTITSGAPSGITKNITIPAGTTVSGLVSLINSSGSDVKARLVNTGTGLTPYEIVLEGSSGVANGFSVNSSDPTAVSFPTGSTENLQNPSNAVFTLNGIRMTRSSNLVTDALDGVSLRLGGLTGSSTVQFGVTFNGTEVAAAVSRFAEAYNLLNDFVKAATGPASEENALAGTLQNNSSIRNITNMLRNKLTARSSSASGDITHWSVLGVALDRNGVLRVDEAKVKASFENKPVDMIRALSNNASAPYIFSGSPSGLAGDMAVTAYGIIRSTGSLADIQRSYEASQTRVEKQQIKLDRDISRIQESYDRQFSALNAVLASFKETSKRLDSTFNRQKD